MTRSTIIKKLSVYLDEFTISKLQMVSQDKSLVLVMTVADICRDYNSTEENEKVVSELLVKLVSICF